MKCISEKFLEVIDRYSYVGKPKNKPGSEDIILWIGAGFSKCWDDRYLLSESLFDIDSELKKDNVNCSAFYSYLRHYLSDLDRFKVDFNFLKFLNYKISVQKEFNEVQNKYFDNQLAIILQNEIKQMIFERIKSVMNFPNEYLRFKIKPTSQQESICKFINFLWQQETGDAGCDEGLRLNIISTNYDFVIEEIFDQIIGDEFQELFLYRGFTPYSKCERDDIVIHNDLLIRNFIKLNGGFEIFEENGRISIEYREKNIIEKYNNISIGKCLILPSYQQDYTSKYFRMIFPKCISLLRNAKILVIIGSSLPEEDFFLRHLLSNFAEQPSDYLQKQIFYIGFNDNDIQVKTKLLNIFPGFWSSSNINIYDYGLLSFIEELNIV